LLNGYFYESYLAVEQIDGRQRRWPVTLKRDDINFRGCGCDLDSLTDWYII